MSDSFLRALEVGAGDDATHVVFWLHGLGDTGFGHEDVVEALRLPDSVRARFILPHAPKIPVTCNGNQVMPAWYDIEAIGGASQHDHDGIARAAAEIEKLIAREKEETGLPAERMMLAGFSQGGVVAMHVALRHPEKLAGAIGLSTYLVGPDTLDAEAHAANLELPVFLGHGTFDPVVPFEAMEKSRAFLAQRGHQVQVGEYPMAHSIGPQEINDLSRWMAAIMTQEG